MEVFLSLLLKLLCFKLFEVQGMISHEISHLTVTKGRFYHSSVTLCPGLIAVRQ